MNINFRFWSKFILSLLVFIALVWVLIYLLSISREPEVTLPAETSDQLGLNEIEYPEEQREKVAKSPFIINVKDKNDMNFDQVPLNSREKTNCSPTGPALPWKGLVIVAPEVVTFESDQVVTDKSVSLPVCGYYRVDLEKLLEGKALALVAVDTATKEEYRGDMLDNDEGIMAPEPEESEPLTASNVEGMSTASYFNPDLFHYIDLPKQDAVYEVYAEYGGYTSNVVRVKVVFEAN
jgi:hypothetical protein